VFTSCVFLFNVIQGISCIQLHLPGQASHRLTWELTIAKGEGYEIVEEGLKKKKIASKNAISY
jgi:hypothetical protein